MPRNPNLDSPTIRVFAKDEVMTPDSLRAIDILADGDLKITDIDGNTITRPFTNVAPAFRWVVQIKIVHDSGTTIDLDNLVGLH